MPEAEAIKSLRDLRRVNHWLGGRRSLLAAVEPYLATGGRLLDVGCGSADLPAAVVAEWPGRVVAVGHRRQAAPPAPGPGQRAPRGGRRARPALRAAVVRRGGRIALPPPLRRAPRSPSCSRASSGLARRALVVNDLHRALVPWVFARSVFPFAFESQVSVDDGLLSIRRAFRPDELRRAFADAAIPRVRVERRFPYRLLAVAEVEGEARR